MNNQPNHYAIIPADVRYDNELKPNAKLLYGEITALTNREGFCWAENAYFASLYQVDDKTISRWISQLRDRGYIGVELLPMEGNRRKITIDKKITTSPQKSHEVVTKKSRGSDKKSTPNKENITINNTKNREESALAFLEQNFPSRYEAFCMKFQTRLGADFGAFKTDFNLKVIEEQKAWEQDILFARLERLAENWVRNQKTMGNTNAVPVANVPGPKRSVFKG